MTQRNMTSGLITASERTAVSYYDLIYMDLDGGIYMSNGPFNITWNGNTYLRDLGILSVDGITENAYFEIEKLNITIHTDSVLGTASDPIIERALQPDFDYIDKALKIWRIYYEHNTQVGVVELYFGYIESMTMSSGISEGSSGLVFQTSNHWSTFQSTNGRYSNTASQALEFSGDLGFDYAAQIQKQISWKAPV